MFISCAILPPDDALSAAQSPCLPSANGTVEGSIYAHQIVFTATGMLLFPIVYTKGLNHLFPSINFNTVPAFPAKEEERVRKWIQVELLLDHVGQTVYTFSQIGVATGDIHLVSACKITKHIATLCREPRLNLDQHRHKNLSKLHHSG